jgi:hypothetical protein
MDTQHIEQKRAYAVRVIDALDGTAAVARLCKTSMAAVSQWKENGIPEYRLDFLRLARPDVFEGLEPPEDPAIPLH